MPYLSCQPLAEQRGVDRRHARRVRVAFGGSVDSVVARALYHLQCLAGRVKAGALDVNDVERRSGYGGRRYHLAGRFNAAHGFAVSLAPNVDVTGRAVLGGDAEDSQDFPARAAPRVVEAEADGERAPSQAGFDPILDPRQFVRRRFAERGVGDGQEVARIVHDVDAHWDMSDARAEVDGCAARALGVPSVHVARADLEFQRGRNPVARLNLVVLGVLAVRVQVDEAGRDDHARRVNRLVAVKMGVRNRHNASVGHADVSDRVESRFRIDHPVRR